MTSDQRQRGLVLDRRANTIEVRAELLVPGDRFRHGNAEFVATVVSVTHGGPVTIAARAVRDGVVADRVEELSFFVGQEVWLTRPVKPVACAVRDGAEP
ncbi:MAG: hypothetical protein AB7O80_10945 [Acetobacteraceae bacterium]